jgi:hypothetical protein
VGTILGDEPDLPDVSNVNGEGLGSEFRRIAPDDGPVAVGTIASLVGRG